jgi:type 1 glutamine amidotransferase
VLIGSIPDQPSEPVLWTHTTKAAGRVVYTSLGHPDDFKEDSFNRLLSNAIHWAAGLKIGEQKP